MQCEGSIETAAKVYTCSSGTGTSAEYRRSERHACARPAIQDLIVILTVGRVALEHSATSLTNSWRNDGTSTLASRGHRHRSCCMPPVCRSRVSGVLPAIVLGGTALAKPDTDRVLLVVLSRLPNVTMKHRPIVTGRHSTTHMLQLNSHDALNLALSRCRVCLWVQLHGARVCVRHMSSISTNYTCRWVVNSTALVHVSSSHYSSIAT
jgi:hypothetical protein